MATHGDLWAPSCGSLVAPDPCVEIDLDGVTLTADPTMRHGISISEWSGWDGGPGVAGGPVAFEAGDGATRGDVYMQSRAVTVAGQIHGRTAEDTADLMEDLSSVLTVNRWAPMVVYEEHLGLERQLTVARAGAVQMTLLMPTIATYTLSVQSDDWRRVGVDLQSEVIAAGGTPLRNLGRVPAALTLHMAGPLTNPGISWPGGAWQYSGSIGTGNMISVDLERRVVRNPATTVHSRRLASGTWLSLPPGTTTVARTGTGTGTITARWRSSWA